MGIRTEDKYLIKSLREIRNMEQSDCLNCFLTKTEVLMDWKRWCKKWQHRYCCSTYWVVVGHAMSAQYLCCQCFWSDVKWDNAFSNFFRIMFGVIQGSVLSPILFALYIDDISNSVSFFQGCHIILYADNIILISPSVLMLQHLLHACEIELNNIDMAINFKKSSCLRICPRFVHASCACITSLDGNIISWATETSYLGIYIVSSRVFKCSLHHAKCGFYRAANTIFGKVGRISSEEVVLQLVKSKCLPILLYCLEVCPLTKTDLKSLDFVINSFS